MYGYTGDKVELGTKIIGNYGAMVPLSFGEVVTIIMYDTGNGAVKKIMSNEIDDAVGKLSPIGYYTEEAYYG